MLPLLLRVAGGLIARNRTTAVSLAAGYSIGFFQDKNPKVEKDRKLITNSKPVIDTSIYGTRREIPQYILLRNQALQKMVDSDWSSVSRNSSALSGLVH